MVDIFRRHHWLGFFEFPKGYNDDITYGFSMELNPQEKTSVTTMVRGISITINPEVINRVTTVPLGVQWRKDDKANNTLANKKLFTNDGRPIEDKNGVRRESLPYP